MAAMFPPAPAPKSALARHRVLSPHADVRVSPLCLGCMNFGDAWAEGLGECNKETTFAILDYFYEQGGNFLDNANMYQNEQSEQWLGEWMKARGTRDEMVIATKYTSPYMRNTNPKSIQSNFVGCGTKSLRHSVDSSLKKLQTDFIDLLYVHWYDHSISAPELMQSLNHLVASGKVLYLGISDTPAWFVAKCNEYARAHGLATFVVYQGKWSAASRDFERDILPMGNSEGMAFAPWGALGGGKFKTEEQLKAGEGRSKGEQSEADRKLSIVLDQIAREKGTAITSVALAYVMHKNANVFPIIGGRKLEHLKGNIEALKLELTAEDIKTIEDAHPFDIGFPLNMLSDHPSKNFLLNNAGHFDYVDGSLPIRPHKE